MLISPKPKSDRYYMHRALDQAYLALRAQEVPVGAVIVDQWGNIIASGFNQSMQLKDPCAHAEIIALRAAGQYLASTHLTQCTLFVTLEPCMMCLGAIINARLARIVYGAKEPKMGMITSRANLLHQPWHIACAAEGGILAARAQQLMQRFFRHQRTQPSSFK